jgi:hypothetical protein
MSLSIPSWVRPGAQCICTFGTWHAPLPVPVRVPMLNEILTIADSRITDPIVFEGFAFPASVGLAFQEIPLVQSAEGVTAEVWWSVTGFKPLTKTGATQADDVALFSWLLGRETVKP